MTAIKVAMRLDLSNFDTVPAKFRSSLRHMSRSFVVHPWMRTAALDLIAQLPEVN